MNGLTLTSPPLIDTPTAFDIGLWSEVAETNIKEPVLGTWQTCHLYVNEQL